MADRDRLPSKVNDEYLMTSGDHERLPLSQDIECGERYWEDEVMGDVRY